MRASKKEEERNLGGALWESLEQVLANAKGPLSTSEAWSPQDFVEHSHSPDPLDGPLGIKKDLSCMKGEGLLTPAWPRA